MPPKNEPAEEPVTLFAGIKNAIARRSKLLKQHEADYATAVQEKDAAIAARDSMTVERDTAVNERDNAIAALQPYRERAEKAEAQLAEIGEQLGVEVVASK